jgi:hypothetical protein
MYIYDKTLNNILKNKNLKHLEDPDLHYIGENGNFCFIKIEFYQNGEIKNYYLPNGFEFSFFTYIEDIVKLSIPKTSSYAVNVEEGMARWEATRDNIMSNTTLGFDLKVKNLFNAFY